MNDSEDIVLCKSVWFGGNAVKMHRKYGGNAVEIQWKYSGNAVKIWWKYGGNAMKIRCRCSFVHSGEKFSSDGSCNIYISLSL